MAARFDATAVSTQASDAKVILFLTLEHTSIWCGSLECVLLFYYCENRARIQVSYKIANVYDYVMCNAWRLANGPLLTGSYLLQYFAAFNRFNAFRSLPRLFFNSHPTLPIDTT